MKCPRCGKALPSGAGFCMYCGQPVNAAPIPTPGVMPLAGAPMAPPADPVSIQMPKLDAELLENVRKTKVRNTAIIGGCFLAATVCALLLNHFGYLSLFAHTPQESLSKVATRSSAPLEKVASQTPAPLEKTASRITMPDDIRDWLEFLNQTEQKRVKMVNNQELQGLIEKQTLSAGGSKDSYESAINGTDDPNAPLKSPTDDVGTMIGKMHDETMDLLRKFDAFPAPTECKDIQAAYDQTVSETASEMDDISRALTSADTSKLMGTKDLSKQGIDAPGALTDKLVQKICDKYETKKWFKINSDISFGGNFSLPGF